MPIEEPPPPPPLMQQLKRFQMKAQSVELYKNLLLEAEKKKQKTQLLLQQDLQQELGEVPAEEQEQEEQQEGEEQEEQQEGEEQEEQQEQGQEMQQEEQEMHQEEEQEEQQEGEEQEEQEEEMQQEELFHLELSDTDEGETVIGAVDAPLACRLRRQGVKYQVSQVLGRWKTLRTPYREALALKCRGVQNWRKSSHLFNELHPIMAGGGAQAAGGISLPSSARPPAQPPATHGELSDDMMC
ncbi:unnamed protein product [Lampetra fluviatilis]